jgi:hypothetical protein|tara:strand:- start:219 stop:419 length:201 start_codon:yes stop_codon:yes gene_type:complete
VQKNERSPKVDTVTHILQKDAYYRTPISGSSHFQALKYGISFIKKFKFLTKPTYLANFNAIEVIAF